MTPKRVLIVQAMCKQYRAPLFARMHEELSANGIQLRVAYSAPVDAQRSRNDDVDLPAEYGIKLPCRSFFNGRICWQAPIANLLEADLIIVEHALKHVINYPLLLLSRLGVTKLGLWVHGGSLRHASASWLRPYRLWSMLTADWIFAYTQGVADAAARFGANQTRVTALNNAIDLSSFRTALAAVTEAELAIAREQLGLPSEAQVALFCGSLYAGRGVDFLLDVGDRVAGVNSRFHLLVIGSGPLAAQLNPEQSRRPWLHSLGSIFGDRRAVYFRLAQVCLMPYLAGLGILDAMAAGLPYLVTGERASNPEIEYLEDGVTGLITGDSASLFAQAIVALLDDPRRLDAMAAAAQAASRRYSIEAMSDNFCEGIRGCLSQPARGLFRTQARS